MNETSEPDPNPHDAPETHEEQPHGTVEEKPKSGSGFVYLNTTQFFGAANDNILKQVLIFGVAAGGIWADKLGQGAQAYASLCLAIPFVLLSGFAGQFADRFSKRDVSIAVKLSEIVIAVIAFFGLLWGNLWMVLTALVLISMQSAFFSPAKYGILPEIIEKEKLSRANGTINMFTYVAVILGGAVGGPLYDAYAPDMGAFHGVVIGGAGQDAALPNGVSFTGVLWLPGVILLIVAALGTAASFGIPRLKAQNPTLKIRPVLLRMYIDTWRDIGGTPQRSVQIAWAFFYMIVAGVAILIIPDYKKLLGITATQTSILMVVLGVSIGVGDFVAGRVSGHRVRIGLIPIGAIGTTVSFFVLGLMPLNFNLIAGALCVAGFMAGFFMVPVQTMVQRLSSEEERGRVLGLWNCGSFVGVILGNLIFLVARQLGMPSNRVFLVCGVMGIICCLVLHFRWLPTFRKAMAKVEPQ